MTKRMLISLESQGQANYYMTELGATAFAETLGNVDTIADESAVKFIITTI